MLRDLASSERELRSRNGGWCLMRLRPYRTVDNRIDGVVVTFVDIGERRRAEDALRESEARMRAVIDGVTDAIVTFDEYGIVQSRNAATTANVRLFSRGLDRTGHRNAHSRGAPRFSHEPDRASRRKENHRSKPRG